MGRRWNHQKLIYSQLKEFCIQKPVDQQCSQFHYLYFKYYPNFVHLDQESLGHLGGANILYRHKYVSPSTLIVLLFTCILKAFDQTVSKNLIFQTSFNDGDNAGVDSVV